MANAEMSKKKRFVIYTLLAALLWWLSDPSNKDRRG